MVPESAPVPHPTSSQWEPAGTSSQVRNSRATRRLQRPTYGSYASPTAQILTVSYGRTVRRPLDAVKRRPGTRYSTRESSVGGHIDCRLDDLSGPMIWRMSLARLHWLLTAQSALVVLLSINRLSSLTLGYALPNEGLRWVDFNNMLVLPLAGVALS